SVEPAPAPVDAVEALAEPDNVVVRRQSQRETPANRPVVADEPGGTPGIEDRRWLTLDEQPAAVFLPARGCDVEPARPPRACASFCGEAIAKTQEWDGLDAGDPRQPPPRIPPGRGRGEMRA